MEVRQMGNKEKEEKKLILENILRKVKKWEKMQKEKAKEVLKRC